MIYRRNKRFFVSQTVGFLTGGRAVYGRQESKYNASRTSLDGITYDSAKEASYAAELTLRQKAGDIERWERQVVIALVVNGRKICDYRIDFVVFYPDGRREYVEVKGMETALWKLKWNLLKALHEDEFLAKGWVITIVK